MSPLPTVTPQQAKAWLDANEAVLVDVREPAEYKAEHITGSHLVPLGTCCPETLPPVDGKKIIIHCKAGKRGEQACAALGAPDREVYNLAGGLDAWAAAGLPVERGRALPLMRQVQIAVGSLVVVFTVLGFVVHPVLHGVAGAVGLGLLNAGVTGWCGMALLLAKMPWNR